MRKKFRFVTLLAILGCSVLFVSCSNNKAGGNVSKATGWSYNDANNDYIYNFQNFNSNEKPGPGLIAIQGGTFTMGATQEDVFYEWNNAPRQVTVSSFYIDETEVSNIDYLEYIYWLQHVFGKDMPEMVAEALPDTMVWRNSMAYNEPMVEVYFRHPAYRDYPVVGVSWLKANKYALWRSDRVNEQLLINAGVINFDPDQNKDNYFTTDGYLSGLYEAKLANGVKDYKNGTEYSRNARMEDGIMLPKYRLPSEAEWEYAALGLVGNSKNERVAERRTFPWDSDGLRSQEKDYMGVAGGNNDGADFPAPVYSYWPNDYGLYNMSGNVSEWVADIYRPLSFEDISDQNPYRGVNYNDGDYKSTIQNTWTNQEGTPESYTSQMYDYGNTTLISDHSRVYKGGSWADGPYYLSPSVRRFLEEDQATATIGFRCAMNMIKPAYAK